MAIDDNNQVGIDIVATSNVDDVLPGAAATTQVAFNTIGKSAQIAAADLLNLNPALLALNPQLVALATASTAAAVGTGTLVAGVSAADAVSKSYLGSLSELGAAAQTMVASQTAIGESAAISSRAYNESVRVSQAYLNSLQSIGTAGAAFIAVQRGAGEASNIARLSLKDAALETAAFASMMGIVPNSVKPATESIEEVIARTTGLGISTNQTEKDVSIFAEAMNAGALGAVSLRTGATGVADGMTNVAGRAGIAAAGVRAVVDETLSGRYRQLTGTLARLAITFTGFSGATLLAVAGVAALAGGIGYLIYEEIALNNELNRLTEAQVITGQASASTRGFLEQQYDMMRSAHGVSRALAEELMELESADAHMSAQLTSDVNQLLPMFVEAYGKKAPQEVHKLLEALNDLTSEGLARLDKEMLNLAPDQYEMAQNFLSAGDKASAANVIITNLAERGKINIKSLGDQIVLLNGQLAEAVKNANEYDASIARDGRVSAEYAAQVNKLTEQLKGLHAEQEKSAALDSDNAYKSEGDRERVKDTNARTKATQDLVLALQHEVEAEGRMDSGEAQSATQAVIRAQKELTKITEDENKQEYEQFKNLQEEKVSETERGSAARLAVAEAEMAEAKRLLGEQSSQYLAAANEKASIERASASEGKRLTDEQYRNAIDTYREQSAAFAVGSKERIAIVAQEVALAIKTYGAGATQVAVIDREMTENLRASAEQQTALVIEQVNQSMKSQDQDYERTVKIEEEKVRAKQVTASQVEQLEVRMAQAIYNMQLQELNKEAALGNLSVQQAQAIATKKLQIQDELDNRLAAAQSQANAVELKGEETLWSSVARSAQSSVLQIIKGHENLRTALGNIADIILEKFITAQLLRVGNAIMGEAAIKAATNSTTIAQIASWLFGSSAATTADVTQATVGIHAASGTAYANAYAATAAIPYIGPELAPASAAAAGAGALGGGMSFLTVPAAEMGMAVPKGMNPLVQMHEEEWALPAHLAKGMEGLIAQGGGGSPIHIHATDADSVKSLLMNNKSSVAAALGSYARNLMGSR